MRREQDRLDYGSVSGLSCVPSPCVEALAPGPIRQAFGDGAFKEIMKAKRGPVGGP